jgi:predicted Zn-dependent protease
LEQAARAVEAEPDSAILHVQLGLALIESDQEVDGYAEIQLASELAKSDVPLLLGMAKTLERQERWPGALSMYLRVFEARPRLSMLSDNLRRAAYFTAGHPLAPDLINPEAVQKADKPAHIIAQARYLVVHQGKFAEARELLGQIRKDLDAFPEAGLVEAEALFLEEKPEEARTILSSILERYTLPLWVRQQAETLLNQYQ